MMMNPQDMAEAQALFNKMNNEQKEKMTFLYEKLQELMKEFGELIKEVETNE